MANGIQRGPDRCVRALGLVALDVGLSERSGVLEQGRENRDLSAGAIDEHANLVRAQRVHHPHHDVLGLLDRAFDRQLAWHRNRRPAEPGLGTICDLELETHGLARQRRHIDRGT